MTVWFSKVSHCHVCCTCTSAEETLTAKLLQTLSSLAKLSRAFGLILETQEMQILRPRCQHLLFITVKRLNMQRNATKIKVKNWFIFSNTDSLELIIQFIIVRGQARLLLLLSGLNLCCTRFLAATAIDFKKQMWQMLCILGETQPCNYRKKTFHLHPKIGLFTWKNLHFGKHLECNVIRMHTRVPSCSSNMGEYAAKSQWLLLHVSAGNRLWSQLWIGPLHTDYFKALIIHQGRREAKREGVKKSLQVSLSHWSNYAHRRIKYAVLGLALGNLSYISMKRYIISCSR